MGLGLSAALLVGCSSAGHKANAAKTPTTSGTATTATSGAATAATSGSAITIDNFAFSPASISVKVGTKVTVTNKDSTTHTWTADKGQGLAWDSSNLTPGKSYSFTFTKPGTYKYHCNVHASMTGTIVVS